MGDNNRRSGAKPVALAISSQDWLRRRIEILPRPIRFLGVGGIGLLTDLSVFTAIPMHTAHPIAARCVSLAVATLVTWRLNRALTFDGERAPAARRGDALRRRHADGARHELRRVQRAGADRAGARAAGSLCWPAQRPVPASPMPAIRCSPSRRAKTAPFPPTARVPHEVDTDVLVIGAGPAGLTAAYCLTKETPSVIVIEKDPVYVGGISRTVRYKDFLFDIGGHRFFSKSKEVVDLWHEILPDDFIERPRLSRIFYGGKYYSYPLSAFQALANLGIFTSAACMLSYAYARDASDRGAAHLPRLGAQPVRRAAVPDFLQDLHREGVGHVVRRDFRRLGGAAHQGPRPARRDRQRAQALASRQSRPPRLPTATSSRR